MAETNADQSGPASGNIMSNIRIASILFSIVIASALIALAWYQTHGGHIVLSVSNAIVAMAVVFSLLRFIPALIRCVTKRKYATRCDKIS